MLSFAVIIGNEPVKLCCQVCHSISISNSLSAHLPEVMCWIMQSYLWVWMQSVVIATAQMKEQASLQAVPQWPFFSSM